MAEAADLDSIRSKHKAISALFPYFLAQDEPQWIVDTFLRLARASQYGRFMWRCVGPYITTLFNEPTPPFPDILIVLASPRIRWHESLQDGNTVAQWAKAVDRVVLTEEFHVGQAVVDALLQIASVDSLRPHIPEGLWGWLEIRPSLPPRCLGRSVGAGEEVVRYVRAFGTVEVFTSYLSLVWSEWNLIGDKALAEMHISIRENSTGLSMKPHREDLIGRLDHILQRMDLGKWHFRRRNSKVDESYIRQAKEQYRGLRSVLLEVDGGEENIPIRTPSTLILFGLLMPTDAHRILLGLDVRFVPPMPIGSHSASMILLHQFRPPRLYSDRLPLSSFGLFTLSLRTVQTRLDVHMLFAFSQRRKSFCSIFGYRGNVSLNFLPRVWIRVVLVTL